MRLKLDSKPNQQKKRLSLRLKATLLAVAISTLPVLGVGTTAYIVVSNLTRQEIEKSEKRLATEVQNHLNQYMWERFGDIQIMATLDIFTNPTLRQNTTNEEKNTALEQFLKAYPIYDNIAVFNIKGDPIAQTQGAALGNQLNSPYFQDALSSQKPILSQPLISNNSETFSIYSAAPIKDKFTGEIIGIISARVPVNKLSDLIKSLQPQLSKSYYLIDGAGKVFFSPKGQYLNQVNSQVAKPNPTQISYQGKPIEEIFPDIKLLREVQSTSSILSVNSVTQTKKLITYIPPNSLPGLPDLNWSVVLASDAAVLFAAQRQQLLILLIGIGFTIVIVLAVSTYLVNRAIRPLVASAQAVEKIGQGELDTRIPVKGNDELATLGTNINGMADQLQDVLQAWQQKSEQLKQHNDVLSDLALNQAVIQGNAKLAAKAFTEAIAQTLNLERVGIWLYNSNGSNLTCLDQYDLSLQQHCISPLLDLDQSSKYFQLLQTKSFIVINDVQTNPVTYPLVAAGLLSLDTQLLVSAPIQIAERVVGLIRCDHVNTSRSWQEEEQTFVTSVANLVSIVVENDFLQQEVTHLLDVVSNVEEGDLTAKAHVSNRITGLVADTFNQLIERLADVLQQVLKVAHQASQEATQQKTLVETVATNAEQQAHDVSQVLDLTEQVEQAAQGSAARAKASNESLQTVSTTLALGQEAIASLTQGIAVLQEGTDRIMQRVKSLGEFVGLADQFVQNQSQIAFSTQTLSMNASLVAARASQQRDPKQFVIVAREFDSIAAQVSKLAQQTSEGLTNLERQSAQIYSVVSTVDSDVQSLGELVKQLTTGVEQSHQAFNHVQAVTVEAIQAGAVVNDFSHKIVEASQTTADVVRDIAELANKTAALTQIARERSDQMDLLSVELLQTVQFFQLPEATEDDSVALLPTADHIQTEEITLNIAAQEVTSSQVLPA